MAVSVGSCGQGFGVTASKLHPEMPTPTPEQVRALARVEKAMATYEHDMEKIRAAEASARARRDQVLAAALDTGLSLRQVGEVAGLSHEQIRRAAQA